MPRLLLSWVAGLTLVVLGANLMDPYMAPVRGVAPFGIIAAAALGLRLTLRDGGRRRWSRWLLVLLWCAAPVSVAAAETVFHLRKHAVLTTPRQQLGALGQHFIVGYTDLAEVETLAAKGLIGGVFVTRRNIAGRTAEDLRRDIARLQDVRRATGQPPLIIATDQEGGIVNHLSPSLPALPSLATLAAVPAAQRAAAARDYGLTQGRQLAALGITVNFAPVLDLRRRHAFNPLDFNSLIRYRAISDDPRTVGAIGAAYAQGIESAGVAPTVKHFPGMGRVATDTHHFRASLDTSRAELEASDWQPFRQVLADSDALLMVGHVTLTAIDPDHPASQSRRVVEDILRRDWGYQGLLVTDDLDMSAVYQHGLCDAVSNGLNAGIDKLLVAFDGRQYYRTMQCALDARRRGVLDEARLADSDRRLSLFRRRAGAPMDHPL